MSLKASFSTSLLILLSPVQLKHFWLFIVPSTLTIRPFNKLALFLELLLTCWKSMRQEKSIGLKLANDWDDLSSSEMTLPALWHGRALFTPAGLSVSLVILGLVCEALWSVCTGSGSFIDQYVQVRHGKRLQTNINLVDKMCQKWRKVRVGFELFNLYIVIDFYRSFCSFTPVFVIPWYEH